LPFASEKIKYKSLPLPFLENEILSRRFLMKFVVIGGDASGMSAASRVKRNQPDAQVTVLEQTKDVSYSA
jgi:hypothetical protein